MPTCDTTRRRFTEAARDAAALARKRKRDHKAMFPEEHELVMVVVRAVDVPRGFAWQIRRFGRMGPVAQSRRTFPDAAEAGHAGRAALDAMRAGAAAAGG